MPDYMKRQYVYNKILLIKSLKLQIKIYYVRKAS